MLRRVFRFLEARDGENPKSRQSLLLRGHHHARAVHPSSRRHEDADSVLLRSRDALIPVVVFAALSVELFAVKAGIPVVTNQCQYSLLDRRPQKVMADFCARTGVKLICYGTMAGGFLSEKWLGQPRPEIDHLETRSLVKYLLVIDDTLGWEGYQELLGRLASMKAETGLSIAVLATLYVLGLPHVAAAIVATRSSRHIADTTSLIGRELPQTLRRELDAFVGGFPQIESDSFDAERELDGKHRNIMRMNLMDSTTGK